MGFPIDQNPRLAGMVLVEPYIEWLEGFPIDQNPRLAGIYMQVEFKTLKVAFPIDQNPRLAGICELQWAAYQESCFQ